jgi:hypothetical protein
MQFQGWRAQTLAASMLACLSSPAGGRPAKAQATEAGVGDGPAKTARRTPASGHAPRDEARVNEAPTATQADTGVTTTVDSVVEEPGRYYGRVVTVRGEIEDTIGPRSFTLDENSLDATTDLFVLLPHSASGLREDTEVTVTGRVRRFMHVELQREHDWFDATPDVVARHEGHPVIIASSVRNAAGTELLNPDVKAREHRLRGRRGGPPAANGANGDGANGNGPNGEGGAPLTLTPAQIAADPTPLFGREVVVSGRVEDVITRSLFTLDEDARFAGPDVIVLNPRPALATSDGAQVTVSGVLRRFDYEQLKREFPWLELRQRLVDRLTGRPVIVAAGIATGEPPAAPPAQ